MFLKLFILILLSTSFEVFSQNYVPIDSSDYSIRKEFVNQFKHKNKKAIIVLKERFTGKTGKELGKIYTDFSDYFSKEVEEKNYAFKSGFEDYLLGLLKELQKENPNIPKDLKVLVAKNNTPNAYCLFDGSFIINLGLFRWLDNSDQIASVLAHELGHRLLEHNLKNQLNRIETNLKNKNEIQQLGTLKFNRSVKAFDLLKKQSYDKGQISRKHEIESDSVGYILFKKSMFKKIEFINALKNMKSYDTISPYEVKKETYKLLFDLPNEQFKEDWLKMEDFSSYNYNLFNEKIDKDSISSHPETDARLDRLKSLFPELTKTESPLQADETFIRLQKVAQMEILPNFFHDEDYGLGIYACLQFIQNENEVNYHKKWLGKCFQKIHEGRKNYQLNRYLHKINPKEQSLSYQQYLSFMWNLKLNEIKAIADFYSKEN